MYKKSAFITLLDGFIPASIRNNTKVARSELVRTQAMVAVLGISVIVPMLMLLAYIVLQLLTDRVFTKNIIILLATEVFFVSQHLYFQSYGNLRITAGVYSLQFLFIIITTVILSDGLNSPVLILLMCAPMIAFMTMSLRAAVYHIVAAAFTLVGLLVMNVQEFGYISIAEQANYPYTLTICWGVALLFFSLFLVVFEELVRSKD